MSSSQIAPDQVGEMSEKRWQVCQELLLALDEAKDSRDILLKAGLVLDKWFGPFDVYLLVISDDEGERWSAIPIESPSALSWGAVAAHQLEPGQSMDAMAAKVGRDISREVMQDGSLKFLQDRAEPLLILSHEDDQRRAALSHVVGLPLTHIIASPWKRPRGGHGWTLLGRRDDRPFSNEQQECFPWAVRLISRMALYPSLMQFIQSRERHNLAMRRSLVHDLKNPIAVIKGYTQTLEADLDHPSEMAREMMTAITDMCDRLIEDLRDILLPVEEVMKPRLEEFDLSLVLHRVVSAEMRTERSQDHEIILEGAESPFMITADRRKIYRVCENLISNAVKYSPGVDKRVWIRLKLENGMAVVSIQDEGIGMDDVQLVRVMNRTGRVVDPSLSIEGTGLGLASVRQILAVHSGQLDGESELGHGSTFTARIPVIPPV